MSEANSQLIIQAFGSTQPLSFFEKKLNVKDLKTPVLDRRKQATMFSDAASKFKSQRNNSSLVQVLDN